MERILWLTFHFLEEPLKIALKVYNPFVNKTKSKYLFWIFSM